MRIMCLNGWGGTLHEALVPYLRATRPDVLCLQEVVHTPTAQTAWLTYRDGDHVLPQRARFFDEVRAALPGHVATFCPAAQGALWDGDRPVPSQWGLASFVRSDIPVTEQVQGFVHKGFGAEGFGAHPRSRSAHVMKLWDYEAGGPLTVAHMHGLRDLAGKADTPARLRQAQRFVDLIRAIWRDGAPLVVCGDFNVEPGSATFDVLARLGVADLVTAQGVEGTRTSHYKKPGRFADYMLVNGAVGSGDFQVVRTPEVSDHCPLLLDTRRH